MAEAAEKLSLHRLVDQLPASEIVHAERYLEFLRDRGVDPVIRFHEQLPFDDEPLTPEEEAGIEEALEDYRQGRVISLEELEQDLQL